MAELTITWQLDDTEVLLLDQLVVAWNIDAADAFAAKVLEAAAQDPPGDPVTPPIPETRESFVTRLGLKSLRGQIGQQRAAVRKRNLLLVAEKYDDPTISRASKVVAMSNLGLHFEGILLVEN